MYTLPRKWKMIKTWCLLACKKLTSSLTSFLRYHKDIANLSNYLVENFDAHQHTQNQLLSHSVLSWDNVKVLHTCYFEYFMHVWSYLANMIVLIVEMVDVSLHKEWILSLTCSLKYCKEWGNLIFWVLWMWVTMLIKIDSIIL